MTPADERLTQLLLETHIIAMVGASLNPGRASFRVGAYMAAQGYRVIPVNPGHAGKSLFGEEIVPTLADIDTQVDMLNIFRRSEHILPVVERGLDALPELKSVWMQLGLENAEARVLAESQGKSVVEDRCLLIEHRRLIARR